MASFSDEEVATISKRVVVLVDSEMHLQHPQECRVNQALPDTADCPLYALVLCCWNNILGPHAKCIWLTEGKEQRFTANHIAYLSTHTLTSCEQPQSTIDTKVLILPERGIVATVFLFSGHDYDEKTIFALSLVIPYEEYRWYLPLHELCVARLTTMIRRLRVLQEKNKDENNDSSLMAFSDEVPSFIRVVTLLKTHGLPSRVELGDTVFAPGHAKQLDDQFTKIAIASHLQTCGCSIILGNTAADVNMMISTLALFLSPTERHCCLYLDDVPRVYQKDVLIQGFLKNSISLDDYLRVIMTSQYPTTLIDLVTLEVKQTLHYNQHAYRRHEATSQELQCLWLNSDEPLRYSPVVHFSNKPEAETIVQKFWKEINRLQDNCRIRETYIEEFLRLLDRKAVSLIKYVEEETNRGTKPSRLVLKRLKSDLHLIPEGDFRIVIAMAEKLQPGVYTLVCGNPALPRDSYNDLVTPS
ncbi:guanine nucleotide exchange C9orf72-like [Acanthaster planci]|uniref:Guanine nucleotide exchange C9orf72-like n=1 Tax=Acanthaster planci TaxID=133434 RepID=A0A8B7Z3J4_ACAPL|nr:guanine nucleotide exchange C9orf72-like [Acanthaster planci]